MNTKIYIFSLDYGNRCTEREFVKEMLRNFDENSLTGCGIFVNNNPYRLDLLLYVSVLDEIERFEDFIKQKLMKAGICLIDVEYDQFVYH